MKQKKWIGVLLIFVIMLAVCSCRGKKESKDNSINGDIKEDMQKNIQEHSIARKAPTKMDKLNILSATEVTYFLSVDEKQVMEKEKVEAIKEIIANSKINEDTTFLPYEGGILFKLYNGKSELCEISLAGPDNVGKFMVTNKSYQFFCDISEKDVKTLKDMIK